MTNSQKRQARANAPANELTGENAGRKAGPVELAARSGNILQTLIALRQKLATVLDNCSSQRDVAVVAKPFADVCGLIEALERSQRGQQSRTAASNGAEAEVRSRLSETAAFRGGIRDELL